MIRSEYQCTRVIKAAAADEVSFTSVVAAANKFLTCISIREKLARKVIGQPCSTFSLNGRGRMQVSLPSRVNDPHIDEVQL